MEAIEPWGGPRRAAWIAALAAAYFVAAKLGLKLAAVHPSATSVWPPTGISIAALLLGGSGLWPGVFAGALLANLTTAGNLFTSAGIAAGNTLEALLGAWLVERYAGGRAAFDRVTNIFKFALLAGAAATAVSPLVGVSALCLGGFARWASFGSIATTWWFGDMAGAFIVAPLILLWRSQPPERWSLLKAAEAGGILAFLWLADSLVFGAWHSAALRSLQFGFLCVPALVWTAFRFGRRETAAANLLLAGYAIWGTLHGAGPFSGERTPEQLMMLQVFVGVNSMMALAVAAAVEDGRRAHQEAERLVDRRTAALQRANDALRAEMAEREKAEEKTRLYSDVVRNAQVGLAVLRFSDGGGFSLVAANPAAEKAAGGPLQAFLANALENRVPELTTQVVGRGKARDLGESRFEGHVFELKAFPLPDRCVGLAFENVTEQRAVEEQLRESRERFSLLVESVKDYAIYVLDAEGRVASWNYGAERIFGWRAAEVIGKDFALFFTREDVGDGKPRRTLIEAAVEGRVQEEGWRLRKDGTRFWGSSVLTGVKDQDGNLKGFAKVTRDITAQREAEEALKVRSEELARSNAELNLFSSIVAHELQEPLRKIVAFGELLKEGAETPAADAAAYRGKMVDAADRMQRLVDDILSLSRVTTQAQPMERVDLGGVVAEIAADFKERFSLAKAELSIGALPCVNGDVIQLRQLFANLIGNAFKFRRKDCPLRVDVRAGAAPRGFVEIRVADNGIGFDDEFRERIFKPFQRLHRRTEYGGSGMGLAICDRILLRHGGRIEAHGKPGEGSVFVVTLPSAEGASHVKN